jgi:hypothetical protein
MKKLLSALAFMICFQASMGQSGEKFTAAMRATISAIDTSFGNPASLLAVANKFERIASAEKSQWLPYYYAALCQVNYGFMKNDPSQLDQVADRAEALVSKADSLSPGNSEISTLKAMIATQRMVVNPMQRYMQYAPVIESHLEKAKAQDPTNPRPYWFKGENLKNTPEQYGGGCAAAMEQLKTAKEKFATFKPASDLHPNWGMQRIEVLLNECK